MVKAVEMSVDGLKRSALIEHSRRFRNSHICCFSRNTYSPTELITGFLHTCQNPIWLLPRQLLSPSSSCCYCLDQSTSFPHLTRAFRQRQWQSASSMYTKPYCSHDRLCTCRRRQHSLHSSFFFFPNGCQVKPRSRRRFFLLCLHMSGAQCF